MRLTSIDRPFAGQELCDVIHHHNVRLRRREVTAREFDEVCTRDALCEVASDWIGTSTFSLTWRTSVGAWIIGRAWQTSRRSR